MPTLGTNKTTTWEKNKYAKVALDYPGTAGSGSVSVKQNEVAQSKSVPGSVDLNKSQAGSLTNNTTETIEYTLS